jgi:hypothetical protein
MKKKVKTMTSDLLASSSSFFSLFGVFCQMGRIISSYLYMSLIVYLDFACKTINLVCVGRVVMDFKTFVVCL